MWRKGLLFAIATLTNLSSPSQASDFSFFDSNIDYWHEQKKEGKTSAPTTAPEKAPTASASTDTKFDWKKHLDPNSKDFFREGDYTPPEPFMELVRNPTDENIKNWFAMIEKKNELSDRMRARIQEYLAKNGSMEPQSKAILIDAKASLQKTPPDASLYRFRFYFDSQCPHCKRMFETVADLQAKGFYVEAIQVDKNDSPLPGLTMPVMKASKEEIEKQQIHSVPYLLIGDLKKKVVYRLAGYQSTDSVFAAINAQAASK